MDFGINFRATSGFVTDPAGTTYCTDTDTYPTTRGGFTFGLNASTGQAADRDNTIDARLAGIIYTAPLTVRTFRLDLDAANNKDINLANGETNNQGAQDVEVFDNTASVLHINPSAVTAYKWWDATGVERTSAADWVNNNAPATGTSFSSTTLNLKIGNSATGFTVFAHLHVKDSAAGGDILFGQGCM